MNANLLTSKWQHVLDQAAHIFTWTEPHALAYLADYAHDADLIVESGTYMGHSAKVMLAAGVAHLWCVDPFAVAGTYETTRYFLGHEIRHSRCELIRKRSPEAVQMLEHVRGKLDMVFVDDGHAYEDVCLDIDCWLPMLKPGGLLCGHDFDQHPDNGVTRAVKEKLAGWTEPVPRIWAYVK